MKDGKSRFWLLNIDKLLGAAKRILGFGVPAHGWLCLLVLGFKGNLVLDK